MALPTALVFKGRCGINSVRLSEFMPHRSLKCLLQNWWITVGAPPETTGPDYWFRLLLDANRRNILITNQFVEGWDLGGKDIFQFRQFGIELRGVNVVG